MKTMMMLPVALAGLLVAAPAKADGPAWGFGIGFGRGGVHVSGFVGAPHRHVRPIHPYRPVIVVPAPVVHVHTRVPIYAQVWVPARYQTVFVGYNLAGLPVYRTVCVATGHYETVTTGYRCGGCGVAF